MTNETLDMREIPRTTVQYMHYETLLIELTYLVILLELLSHQYLVLDI